MVRLYILKIFTYKDLKYSRSAVQAGYLNDSFVKYMIKDKAKIKRPPIINRGTKVINSGVF